MKSFANIFLVSIFCSAMLLAAPKSNDKAYLSIDGMEITDLIKLVAATMHKNIFISEDVAGKISYAGNKPINKKDLYGVLQSSLDARGYTLIDNGGGYLSVVKTADATQMNLPFMEKSDIPQMQTHVFTFHFSTAEVMGAKIKHFTSKNAKITASKESNSVLVTDFPENILTIQKAMKILDVKDETTANTTHIIPLKNADAKSIVATLNTIIGKMTLSPGQQAPSIASDDSTNSLIVISNDELFKSLKQTILSLDHDRQQVYVRARIIEISDKKAQEVGIKYGVSGGVSDSSGISAFNAKLADGSVKISDITTPLLGTVITPQTLKNGILLGANIALLNTNGAANILSEPSILCIDNQESSLYVGKTQSISLGVTQGVGTGITQNLTRQDIGLTLKIKPRLSNDNKVLLGVNTKLEDIESELVVGQPSTIKREVITSAIVNNGESVIIGGLIREKNDETNSKVPLLGDIPVVGNLFKSKAQSHDKINLVIILTPYIIEKSSNLTSLRTQLSELDAIQSRYIANITKDLENQEVQTK